MRKFIVDVLGLGLGNWMRSRFYALLAFLRLCQDPFNLKLDRPLVRVGGDGYTKMSLIHFLIPYLECDHEVLSLSCGLAKI